MRTRPFNLAVSLNLAFNHQITRSPNHQIPSPNHQIQSPNHQIQRSRLCLS